MADIPIAITASFELPPMCGVLTKLGKDNNSMRVGGSSSYTSKAAPPIFLFSKT